MRVITTAYRGYRFRSRLEARWAVFFDALKIEWEYELEGFELSDGTCYLPDFFLPKFCGDLWVEVKPPNGDETKARRFSREAQASVLLAVGAPFPSIYTLIQPVSASASDDFDAVFNRKYLPTGINAAEYRLYVSPESLNFLDIDHAVKAARSARFEFGETP